MKPLLAEMVVLDLKPDKPDHPFLKFWNLSGLHRQIVRNFNRFHAGDLYHATPTASPVSNPSLPGPFLSVPPRASA